MVFEFTPGGIVRPASMSREARIQICKVKLAAISTRKRINLEAALEVGDHLIELKKTAGYGTWLPALAEIGINPRTAQQYISISKYESRAHLEETCASIGEAVALVKAGDAEEQEIPKPEQQAVFPVTPEDETSYGAAAEPAEPTQPEEPPPPPAPPKVETIFCEQCAICMKEGQALPRACPGCKAAREAEALEQKRLKAAGHCSPYAFGMHLDGIRRQTVNMAIDHGLTPEQAAEAAQLKAITLKVLEAKQIFVAWRKELKANAAR